MRNKAHIIGLAIGVVLTLITMIIVMITAGVGHGSYKPATIFFPYTILLSMAASFLSWLFVALAFVQFPLYGWMIGRALQPGRQRYALWLIPGAHVIAVTITLTLQNTVFN